MTRIVPTTKGKDVDSADGKYDAHVRIEPLPGERKRAIFVDVFESRIKDAVKAHIESEFFPLTRQGARDASGFLLGYNFDVAVKLPRK